MARYNANCGRYINTYKSEYLKFGNIYGLKGTSVRVIIYVQTTIHSRKWGILMHEFMRKFEQLNISFIKSPIIQL